MKTICRCLWWGCFITAALVIQRQAPGIDALAPGFLLSLQDKRAWQTAWLFVIFVLIQEGAGSLTFGSAVLWYGGQIMLFRQTERFFVADNVVFVFMLSGSLGLWRWALSWFMCAVQKVPVDYALLLQESLTQAVLIPVIWGLAYLFRPRMLDHGH